MLTEHEQRWLDETYAMLERRGTLSGAHIVASPSAYQIFGGPEPQAVQWCTETDCLWAYLPVVLDPELESGFRIVEDE